MDYYTILAQRAIFDKELTGKNIDTVKIRDKHNLFLGFEGDMALKLASIPDMPYIIGIEKRFIPQKNSQDWHLKRFYGQKVTGISLTPGDRVITILFDKGIKLIFEMTGRNANIIIVENDGRISGAVRTVTKKDSGFREITAGTIYIPPPERKFPDLVLTPFPVLEKLLKSVEKPVLEVLTTSFCCGSRLFAREILERTHIDGAVIPKDLSDNDILSLFKTMAGFYSEIETGGKGADLIFSKDGLPENVFPALLSVPGINTEHFDNVNDAVLKYSRVREVELEKRSLRNFILGYLAREEKRINATILKVEKEAGGDFEADTLERKGNALLINIQKIPRGAKSVTLNDPYDSGELEIDLDPAIDCATNAAKFFIRARKLRAASKLAKNRIESLKNRLDKTVREHDSVAVMDNPKDLRVIYEKYTRMQGPAKNAEPEEKFPRRFKSYSGLDIIVGRNDDENDELVRWAGKNDYWLHAQGVGGSHVIIRSPGRQPPDQASVNLASSIAAYYSKAKTSAIVPVVCTPVKYVVKRKGMGPGKVTYSREKVIFAEPGIPAKNIE